MAAARFPLTIRANRSALPSRDSDLPSIFS